MHFTSPIVSSLLFLGLAAIPALAQDASSIQASLSSMAASLASKDSAIAASATANPGAISSAASSAIYSLTHCDPSFASWYHSLTSVLATETNSASLSAIESSLKTAHPATNAACVTPAAATATASTMTTVSKSGSTVSSAAGTGTASGAAASSTSSTGTGMMLTPGIGMGAFILGLAAWL